MLALKKNQSALYENVRLFFEKKVSIKESAWHVSWKVIVRGIVAMKEKFAILLRISIGWRGVINVVI